MIAIQSPCPVFQPRGLALESWLSAPYNSANSPKWTGTASAGGSGSRTADEATNFPGNGLNLNGFVGARFDGVTNFLTASGVISDYVGSTGTPWSISALLRWNNAVATGGAISTDPCLISDNGGNWGIGITTSGVQLGQWDNTPAAQSCLNTDITAASGTPFSIQAGCDGTNIFVSVNGGTRATSACTTFWNAVLPNTLLIGKNFSGSAFLDMDLMDLQIAKTAFSLATFNNLRSYYRYKFAIGGV